MFLVFTVFILLIITYPIHKKYETFYKLHSRVRNSLFWNFLIRFIMEISFEIVIGICIFMFYFNSKGQEVDHTFLVSNYIVTIFFLTVMGLLPIIITIVLIKNRKNMHEKEFKSKFGASIEGLNSLNTAIIFYPSWFLVRRYIFAYVAF